MADRLTQLQDCLDDLATQMFASLRYINTHHSYAAIPTQPDQNPFPISNGVKNIQSSTQDGTNSAPGAEARPLTGLAPETQFFLQQQQQSDPATASIGADTTSVVTAQVDPASGPTGLAGEQIPHPAALFTSSLRELARDLVLKEQQVEYLISVLPGIGTSEEEQTERIRVLEEELKVVGDERRAAEGRRDEAVRVVEGLASSFRRVV